MKNVISAALFGVVLSAPAFAGPVGEFDATYRETYAQYRAALFQTNTGEAEASAKAMAAFAGAWTDFTGRYGQTPPPQFSEDPAWPETMTSVSALIEEAGAEVAAANLAEAHETLEQVRDVLGEMHVRNGVETFSDRMNAYHAEMEHVLDMDLSALDDEIIGMLREKAGVLDYLAQDLLIAPPPEADGNETYAGLAKGFQTSVAKFLEAVRSGDADAIRNAVAGLKKPYSMLFVKFG